MNDKMMALLKDKMQKWLDETQFMRQNYVPSNIEVTMARARRR